jgi:prolipoprotein diacylglyceryltransferase
VIAAISYPPIPLFHLGPLALSLHGLFAGVGFVAGAGLMLRDARRRGFDTERITSILSWALVGSLVGARAFTIPAHMFDAGYGLGDALSVSGDYSIIGGYAGGIIVGYWRMRRLGADPGAHMDMAAAGLAIGAVVGRLGDLAIVEHLGSPTSFFLGYQLEPGYDVAPQHDALEQLCDLQGFCGPYHHTALYDMIGALVLLGVVVWLRRSWTSRRYGQLFAFWGIWYGVQRFLIDFTRLDAADGGVTLPDGTSVPSIADSVMGPFTGSQWGALSVAVAGTVLFLWLRGRGEQVSAGADRRRGAFAEAAPDEAAAAGFDDWFDADPGEDDVDDGRGGAATSGSSAEV